MAAAAVSSRFECEIYDIALNHCYVRERITRKEFVLVCVNPPKLNFDAIIGTHVSIIDIELHIAGRLWGVILKGNRFKLV